MTKHRTERRRLSRRQQLVTLLLLPFLAMHFAWITPLVEWSCLCDDYGAEFSCCCNCPKCVEERGGFISYCQVGPSEGNGIDPAETLPVQYLLDDDIDGAFGGKSRQSIDMLRCDCQSRLTAILLELQQLLPTSTDVSIFSHSYTKLALIDAKRPPEAIPCQPEVPG